MKKAIVIAWLLFIHTNVFANDISFGAGFGIPYGLYGINMNYKINDTFDFTAAAGYGLGTGLRYHPIDSIKRFRITAFYGTNATLTNSATDEKDKFSGLNFGIGYGSLSDGWDIDLIYIASSDADDEVNKLESQGIIVSDYNENTLKISFGYHW